MKRIKLGKKERQHLEKIDKMLSPPASDPVNKGFATLVREHFNATAIRDAMTDAEKKQLVRAARDFANAAVLNAKPAKTPLVIASLRGNDVFARIARRVVNDDKALAAIIPGEFNKKDAEVLKKYKLKSLAALVKAKLEA